MWENCKNETRNRQVWQLNTIIWLDENSKTRHLDEPASGAPTRAAGACGRFVRWFVLLETKRNKRWSSRICHEQNFRIPKIGNNVSKGYIYIRYNWPKIVLVLVVVITIVTSIIYITLLKLSTSVVSHVCACY